MGVASRVRRLAVAVVVAVAVHASPAAAADPGDIAALQVALRARGVYAGSVDGISGPATTAGVRAGQQQAGIAVAGGVGAATRRARGQRGRPSLGARPVTSGMRGWDVAAAQSLLARAGFPS